MRVRKLALRCVRTVNISPYRHFVLSTCSCRHFDTLPFRHTKIESISYPEQEFGVELFVFGKIGN
jgi:hypothetical protein